MSSAQRGRLKNCSVLISRERKILTQKPTREAHQAAPSHFLGLLLETPPHRGEARPWTTRTGELSTVPRRTQPGAAGQVRPGSLPKKGPLGSERRSLWGPAVQDTNLDDSVLQLIIHETCGSRLHLVRLRYLSGASSPHVNRGPPRGCPRRSPGQPHPKCASRACSTPFSAALLYRESMKK